MVETLGVPAHHGGLVVERPELSIGIVRAVSRPTGLEIELLARRPLDRRSATERQASIRARRDIAPPAPRRLLPPYDEGIDLRVGWLDQDGRAHWEFGSLSASSGDHFEGTNGPSLRTSLRFPPLYDHASLVLAWPEIGFPETVVELSLPDRATVERDTVSIWDAPLHVTRPPGRLRHRVDAGPADEPAVERGRAVAAPQVLHRGEDAVVALTRLTAVDALLSLEVLSVARGERADAVSAGAFPPAPRTAGRPDPEHPGMHGPGAGVAVLSGREAVWAWPGTGSSSGGAGTFRSTIEFALPDAGGDALVLLVAWPEAGLPDACVEIALSGR